MRLARAASFNSACFFALNLANICTNACIRSKHRASCNPHECHIAHSRGSRQERKEAVCQQRVSDSPCTILPWKLPHNDQMAACGTRWSTSSTPTASTETRGFHEPAVAAPVASQPWARAHTHNRRTHTQNQEWTRGERETWEALWGAATVPRKEKKKHEHCRRTGCARVTRRRVRASTTTSRH